MRFIMPLVLVFMTAVSYGDALSELDLISGSTDSTQDPVAAAEEIIESSGSLWHPLGHRVMVMKYTVGRYAAQHGVGYLLLQSPRLATSLLTGGLVGAATTVSKDFVLDLLERSIGSPAELSEDICNAAITQGLEEYEIAYGIARDLLENGSISSDEAHEFLRNRWGIYRLVYAEALYNDITSSGDSIEEQVGGVVAERIVEDLMDEYQLTLGSSTPMPVAEYAFFLNGLIEVLEQSRIGLVEYQPYLDFRSSMEDLNAMILDETVLYGGSPCNWDAEAIVYYNRLQWLVGPDCGTTWEEAADWVTSLGGDWRMPTRGELQELWFAGISSENCEPFESVGTWVWSTNGSSWDFLSGASDTRQWNPLNYPDATRAFAVRSQTDGQDLISIAEEVAHSWPFVSHMNFRSMTNPHEYHDPGIEYFIDMFPNLSEPYICLLYETTRDEVSAHWDMYSDYMESTAGISSIEISDVAFQDNDRVLIVMDCSRNTAWSRSLSIEVAELILIDGFWVCTDYRMATEYE